MSPHDPFATFHDVAVFGGGYAGLAAAAALARRGRRVVLVERRAALAWESGWAFSHEEGTSSGAGWAGWLARLDAVGGLPAGGIDGAQAEIQAHALARDLGIALLFYAAPVAVETAQGLVQSVVLGAKPGLRRLRAAAFIDATEAGELAGLARAGWRAADPAVQRLRIHWRSAAWSAGERSGTLAGLGAGWRFAASPWSDERILAVDLPAAEARPRRAWVPALTALRAAAGDELAGAVVTHGSIVPFPVYQATAPAPAGLPGNLVTAIPANCGRAVATLAQRWELGEEAAAQALAAPAGAGAAPAGEPAWPAAEALAAEVAVAGLGTGGALAALAAARAGARTLAFDPLPFAGGIGTGGGIHLYYFGVRGGLQEEVDARVRAIMPLFGAAGQIRCFHPDAKKAALDALLAEAGVAILPEAQLVAARRGGRRIAEALVATPAGPRRIAAGGWIDATGDGDLGAAAGCRFRYGRAGDGRLHAYTQSVGVAHPHEGRPLVDVVNFDSGYTDPDDVADLTRARHAGVLQHLRARVDLAWRPTGICPAIGLRQARHLATDAVLGLDDLIRRRRFADAIALTGAHYDNHAIDFDLESDQALFWTWGCGGWSERIAGEIPYGTLVPSDLDDTWIACRALGVSEEAHHCVRMQRDIQRIGEVAGLAAALARGAGSRAVDLAALQERLRASGALPVRPDDAEDHAGMGITTMPSACCRAAPGLGDPAAALRGGSPTACWLLAHERSPAVDAALRAALADADPALSFRAAAILAWRRDRAALPRLVAAIDGLEDGLPAQGVRDDQVPRWLGALGLLRLLPDADGLAALTRCADRPGLPFRGRVATAVAVEACAAAGLGGPERIAALLRRLCSHHLAGHSGNPRRHPTRSTHDAGNWHGVAEDDTWVLHLVAARTLRRLGQPVPAAWLAFRDDPRAHVRRAFAALAQLPEAKMTASRAG